MSALDRLRILDAEATKGPWHNGPLTAAGNVWVYSEHGSDPIGEPHPARTGYRAWFTWRRDDDKNFTPIQNMKAKHAEQDAQTIVALRNALPALITLLEAAQNLRNAMARGEDDVFYTDRFDAAEAAFARALASEQ